MSTIVLWVADLQKSTSFYKALFDTDDSFLSEGFASVASSQNEVLLHLLPEEYRSEPSLGEENPIKPVFTVDSISQARRAAELAGGRIKAQTFEHGKWRYSDGTDPDGHIIQLREQI